MTEAAHRTVRSVARRSWWRRWPEWSSSAAAAWSATYGVLGLYWWLGGEGFPFGAANDPSAHLSVLGGVHASTGAPAIAAIGFTAAAVAGVMARDGGSGRLRTVLTAFGVVLAGLLTVLIPDYRVLLAVAYTPILLLAAPFGWPPDGNLLSVYPWPVVNQLICIVGGLLWAGATTAYWRRSRGACASCGRSGVAAAWSSREAVARWGRWATRIAVGVPLIYAATRWAWALGIPLGISEAFLREGQQVGLWWAGAALGTLAIGGAFLTLGLVQHWGEAFPRWIPILGGRRVPPMLAVVPASFVALIVTSAGLMFWRLTLGGGFELGIGELITLQDEWAAILPELLWPAWGVSLGAATLAYHLRRRGPCPVCGRDG